MSKDQCISDAAQVLATALRELSLAKLANPFDAANAA